MGEIRKHKMSSAFNSHRDEVRRTKFSHVVAGDRSRGRVAFLFSIPQVSDTTRKQKERCYKSLSGLLLTKIRREGPRAISRPSRGRDQEERESASEEREKKSTTRTTPPDVNLTVGSTFYASWCVIFPVCIGWE
ncbi:hypothetical protein YC2023_054968 [Brassica napus]